MKGKMCFFLILFILFIGCKKSEVVLAQYNTRQSSLTEENVSYDIAHNTQGVSVYEEINTIKDVEYINQKLQEAINSYDFSKEELSLYELYLKGEFAVQIEGNFTGSGNKEVIGFCEQRYYDFIKSIQSAACLVFDSSGENIEKIFHINYITGDFDEIVEVESSLLTAEALGRPIIWMERVIGYAGDFNGDGKDELYLYRVSGFDRKPIFLGFEETEFVELINLPTGGVSIFITGVDKDEKTIDIQTRGASDNYSDPKVYVINSTFKWDLESKRYKEIFYEVFVVRYRWNPDIQEYEETRRTRLNQNTREEEELD
jgi:hypothetical protein